MSFRSIPREDTALDWVSVRTVIETYMQSVDRKDGPTMLSTFADDAQAVYHSGTPEERTTRGGARIVDEILENIRTFTSSNHGISNFTMRIDGDTAQVDTFAIANVVIGNRMLVRGLRYQDIVGPSPKGLVIHRRVHTPLWQAETPTVPPRIG